jgi:hypothetical protein
MMPMEETREPQQPASAPMAYQPQPAYSTQPTYYAPPAAPPVGRFSRFRRLMRLLFRRMLYGSVVVGRVLRPFAAFIVVILALVGVIGWLGYLLWGPKEAAPAFARAASIPPAPAVEAYLRGQQSFNADLMWDSYSADYQAAQLASGASKRTLQSQADSVRTQGIQFVRSDYIGGVQLDNGGSIYFYTIDLSRAELHRRFPYTFTADADGKIVDVDSPFLRLLSGSK